MNNKKIKKIKKGDLVKVLSGNYVGKQAPVLRVLSGEGKVVVEGVNIVKKHVKGDGQNKESAIIDVIKPIDISNVQLVCPSCAKATRVGFEIKDGVKLRICKKCGKPVDEDARKKSSKSKKKTKKKSKSKTKSKSKKKSPKTKKEKKSKKKKSKKSKSKKTKK